MKCCFNKKVLIGAGVVALALLVISPGTALAALPLLILAICPLSMLLMMRTMRGGMQSHSAETERSTERAAEIASLREEINVLKARQRVQESGPTHPQDAGTRPRPAPTNALPSPSQAENRGQ